MKKIIVLMILSVFVFFLSSCQQSGSGITTLGSQPASLSLSFQQYFPSEQVKNGEQVSVSLSLVNNAECDIAGEVCVYGTLTNYHSGLEESCQKLDLRKIELIGSKIRKDETILQFPSFSYSNVIDRDVTDTIKARAKYSCEISAGPVVCIKSRLNENPECKLTETFTGNAVNTKPAPLTLTKVVKKLVPTSSGIRIDFELTLSKASNGKLSGEEPLTIEAELLGFGNLECKNINQKWYPEDTEKVINCNINIPQVEYVEAPLNVKLKYQFESEISKSITIERVV